MTHHQLLTVFNFTCQLSSTIAMYIGSFLDTADRLRGRKLITYHLWTFLSTHQCQPKNLFSVSSDGGQSTESNTSSKSSFQIDSAIIAAVVKQILKQDDEKLKAALLPSLLCEVVYSKNYDLMYALMKENINFNVSVNSVRQDR